MKNEIVFDKAHIAAVEIHEDVDRKRSAKREKRKARQPKVMGDEPVVVAPVQQHDREPFE